MKTKKGNDLHIYGLLRNKIKINENHLFTVCIHYIYFYTTFKNSLIYAKNLFKESVDGNYLVNGSSVRLF